MLTHIIDNRGKEFSTLVKLGDLLGRSLRENLEIFSIEDNKVTYLTESGKVIRSAYSIKSPVHLYNIEVDTTEILENKEAFSALVDKKVGKLLDNVFNSEYSNAEDTLDNICEMWNTRLKFERIKSRLEEKSNRFGPQNYIVDSDEFSRLSEVKEDLVKFLKENSNFMDIPEIRNAVKLASVVSTSFDLPKISYEQLTETGFYYKSRKNDTLYEHLCKQELLTKELIEAKNNFQASWASNDKITKLASNIYSNEDDMLLALAECISDVPYFALATKKQISDVISNSIEMESDIPVKDINNFVSTLYEYKKPAKEAILKLLNEKYNINVNTLTDIPTFKSLINTEIVIFESLSRLAPKASVLKKTLSEVASMLKLKNGVESIDVADFLNETFNEAGYKKSINETSLMQYMDFNQVADDLSKIGQVLKMLRPLAQGAGMGGAPTPGAEGGLPSMNKPEMGKPGMETPQMDGGLGDSGQYEDDVDPGMSSGEDIDPAQMDPEDAALDADMDADGEEEGLEGEEGLEDGGIPEEGMEGEEDLEEDPEQMGQEELVAKMSELDEIMAMLKSDMGLDGGDEGEEGFEGEESPEEEMAEKGMEGDEEEGGDGDDVHVDVNVDADDEDSVDIGGDDEGEEEPDKKFEKNFKKKKLDK